MKPGMMQPAQDKHQDCVPRQLAVVVSKFVQHSPGSFLELFLPRPSLTPARLRPLSRNRPACVPVLEREGVQ